jgi:hypothetical protein
MSSGPASGQSSQNTLTGSSKAGGGGAEIPAGLSSSSTLSEEVKMSIRSISSEITIFEIKTPLPERTVPPCTAGSTTITTIGPTVSSGNVVSAAGGGGSSVSTRPGSSLLGLNNKHIQLQAIPNPLSRSQQVAAHNRGLSITASSSSGPGHGGGGGGGSFNRRPPLLHQQMTPPTMLNHHKANVNVTSGNSLLVNKSAPLLPRPTSIPKYSNLDLDSQQAYDCDNDTRFDPLMMLETEMFEEEREIVPGGDPVQNKAMLSQNAKPVRLPSHQSGMQKLSRPNRLPQRFQPVSHQQNTSQASNSARPLISNQNRRKPVLVQLVELPDEAAVPSDKSNVISKSSMVPQLASSALIGKDPQQQMAQRRPGAVGQVMNSANMKNSGRSAAPPISRGRVTTRRKKRKRLFSSTRLNQNNYSGTGSEAPTDPPKPSPSSTVKPPRTSPKIVPPCSGSPSSVAVALPSTSPNGPHTSMYRTRTVVKAAEAAENRKS